MLPSVCVCVCVCVCVRLFERLRCQRSSSICGGTIPTVCHWFLCFRRSKKSPKKSKVSVTAHVQKQTGGMAWSRSLPCNTQCTNATDNSVFDVFITKTLTHSHSHSTLPQHTHTLSSTVLVGHCISQLSQHCTPMLTKGASKHHRHRLACIRVSQAQTQHGSHSDSGEHIW